jgi:hypothetical protein
MRWIVSVGALAGVWVCVFHAEAQQPGELSLYSIAVDVDRLTDQSLSDEAVFTVDSGATMVMVKLVSSLPGLDVEIWYPEAEDPIDPENVDEFGGVYHEYEGAEYKTHASVADSDVGADVANWLGSASWYFPGDMRPLGWEPSEQRCLP